MSTSHSRGSSAESRREHVVTIVGDSAGAPTIEVVEQVPISGQASTLSRTAPKRPQLVLDEEVVFSESPSKNASLQADFTFPDEVSRSPKNVTEARRALQCELDELRTVEEAKRRVDEAELQYQLLKEIAPSCEFTLNSPKYFRVIEEQTSLEISDYRLSKDRGFFSDARLLLDKKRTGELKSPKTRTDGQRKGVAVATETQRKGVAVASETVVASPTESKTLDALISQTLAHVRETAAFERRERAKEISDQQRRQGQLERAVTRISKWMRAKNEKTRLDRQVQERKFKQDFSDLKNASKNPYEVFRRQEVEEQIRENRETSEKLKVVRAEQLLRKLEYEKSLNDRKFREKEEHEELERKHQAEMSGQKRKGSIGNFIKRHTIDKVSIIGAPGKLVPSRFVDLAAIRAKELSDVVMPEKTEIECVPKKPFPIRQPSVLEQHYRKEALRKQRAAIAAGVAQQCCGSEFASVCFSASPLKIVFADLTVDETMVRKVKLTNISLTFAQFKLLPIPAEFREFFHIKHEPPGRMSAGTSASVEIFFTPKQNCDIVTYLPLLTTTIGETRIPIECLCKRTVPEISCQQVSFGEVVFGEEATRTLTVKNRGTLSSPFVLDFPESASFRLVKGERRGVLDSELHFEFEFKPSAVEESLELVVQLQFEAAKEPLQTAKVTFAGTCVDVPLFVEAAVNGHDGFDVGHILAGKLFREEIVIRNRGRAGLKAICFLPDPAVRSAVSVSPADAVIQEGASLTFQVSMNFPCLSEDAGTSTPFRFPVRFTSPGQHLPVDTFISGVLTDFRVILEPGVLDFGQVVVNNARGCSLRLRNSSDLLQRFAVSDLPESFSVDESPGVLLPRECREITIRFAPSLLGPGVNATIFVNVVTADGLAATRYPVRIKAKIVQPVVKLNSNILKFRAAPAGVSLSASIEISSRGEPTTVKFETSSDFRSHPSFFALPPRTTQRVQIDWTTREGMVADDELVKTPLAVSCRAGDVTQVLWISCEAATLAQSEISVDRTLIDFGPVLVGDRKLQKFVLKNVSDEPLHFDLPVAENKNFQILSTVARSFLQPGRSVAVAFTPEVQQVYAAQLNVQSSTGIAQIRLRGAGVVPVLTLSEGFVDFPGVSADGLAFVQRAVVLKNDSLVCNAEFSVEFDGVRKFPRHGNSEFFFARPERGSIPPGSSLEVQLIFRPETSMDLFVQQAAVRVQGLPDPFCIWLRAKSPVRQVHAMRNPTAENGDSVPFFINQMESRLLATNNSFVLEAGQKQRWTLGMSQARDPKNKAETTGSAEIVWDASNPLSKWLVKTEPGNKISVQAGTDVQVAFELGNPPPKKKGDAVQGPERVTLKGKLILSGGFVPSGEAPSKEIPIEISAIVSN